MKLIEQGGPGPERIDRYELVAELASGAMATVYLARRSGLGGFSRYVALKRLHPHIASQDDFRRIFLDEARLVANIHHPNVVALQEVDESGGQLFLVMDYVKGGTLESLFASARKSGARIPLPVSVRILLDVLAGLHSAHKLCDGDGKPLAIVHRDVSPQNIIVGVDGIARVTDFGIAHAHGHLGPTQRAELKGKLCYMAPEQLDAGGRLSPRVDIFAAGVVAWEAMTGERLFAAATDAESMLKLLSQDIPGVSSKCLDVPIQLSRAVDMALRHLPIERYATAADFHAALTDSALQCGCLGTTDDVASFVEMTLSDALNREEELVRYWSRLAAGASRRRSADAASRSTKPPRMEDGSSSDAETQLPFGAAASALDSDSLSRPGISGPSTLSSTSRAEEDDASLIALPARAVGTTPAYRVSILKEQKNAISALGPTVSARVLARISPRCLAVIDEAPVTDWIPAALSDELTIALDDELGLEGQVTFWREFSQRIHKVPLFNSWASTVIRAFGTPGGVLKMSPLALNAAGKNLGTFSFTKGEDGKSAVLTVVDAPAEGTEPAVISAQKGGLLGGVDLVGGRAQMTVDDSDKSRGIVRFSATWD